MLLPFLSVLSFSSLAVASPSPRSPNVIACNTIASKISSASQVFYPNSAEYKNASYHWVPSSSQNATCVVEPGTAQDLSAIIKVLRSDSTLFGIKGGGHATNPGYSSTTGVLIAMKRFDEVAYDNATQLATVGAGNLWDNVYIELAKYGVNVVGGRVSGVGVAGFSLGGGYSWLSNRHGLTVDNIVGFELVLPSGNIIEVSETRYPDLLFGLKGGFNNFGIVTKFIMKTYPQGQIWGGLINWSQEQIQPALKAFVNFANSSTDPDAAVIMAIAGSNKTQSLSMLVFYNGPTPTDVFNEFLSLPYDSRDLATRSFYENLVVVSPPYANAAGQRGTIDSPRVRTLTTDVVQSVLEQMTYWSTNGSFTPDLTVTCAIEPFIPSAIVRSNLNATAYAHNKFTSPLALNFFWNNESDDSKGFAAIRSVRAAIEAVGNKETPVEDITAYPNYSLADTPLEEFYSTNLPRLQALAKQYDPTNFMGRTGGLRFQ